MPNISKHIFRNQRDHSHLDARLQWGHFFPQLAMFPMAAMAHPQWWPWGKHSTMTSHGEIVQEFYDLLLVCSFKPMPETYYSSAIIMDHSVSICSERIFMEYQQGIIPKTMDHFRNDPLSIFRLFRLCFFLTTMKPPFRMPLFVPLNPSPASLVKIARWNPIEIDDFPSDRPPNIVQEFSKKKINLHDPFVDVFPHL